LTSNNSFPKFNILPFKPGSSPEDLLGVKNTDILKILFIEDLEWSGGNDPSDPKFTDELLKKTLAIFEQKFPLLTDKHIALILLSYIETYLMAGILEDQDIQEIEDANPDRII